MLFKAIITIAVTVAVLAAPTPDSRRASNGPGMAVPLTKHSSSLNAKNTFDINLLESQVGSNTANTGTLRSSALKRACAMSSQAGLDMSCEPGVRLYHKTNEWYATIFIGTPPKSFTVLIDTGTRQVVSVGAILSLVLFERSGSEFFVPASNGDENCRSHPNLWDTASSRTAKALNEDFRAVFADGAIATGKQYIDNVTFGGFTADTQAIGCATTYSSQFAVSHFSPDGILGMASPSSVSDFQNQSPLLHTLFSEGKLPQSVFSLKLTNPGGELYIGGMNEALYIDSSLALVPVTNMEYWELKIDNIKVNDRIVLTDVYAMVDTGSHLLWGDPSQVLALYQAEGGKAFKDGYYTFPCNSFPSVTFTIGGKPYLVPANTLKLQQVEDGSSDCFSGIAASEDHEDIWVLGTIFLQHFYTVFNFSSESPRIGFATLTS